jgi:hypothetical protein
MPKAAQVPTFPVPPPYRGDWLVTVSTGTPAASAGPPNRQALIVQKAGFAWRKGTRLGSADHARTVHPRQVELPTGWHQPFSCALTADPIPALPTMPKAERRRLAESDRSPYEELRLLYVAVTRARQLLWLGRHGAPPPFLAPVSGSREPRTTGMPIPHPQSWLHRLAQYFSGGRGA